MTAGREGMIGSRHDGKSEDAPRDRSRLLAALAERDRLERVLRLLPMALPGCSPARVADVLVEGACLLANARVGWAVLPEIAPVALAGGPDAGWVDTAVPPRRWPIVARALEGVAVHVPDLLAAKETTSWTPRGSGGAVTPLATADGRPLRSLSALPLARGDKVRGALVLGHHRAHAFSGRQLALVSALVDHLGEALSMCESVDEQTRVAVALQETLLPPVLPSVDGVEIAARYRPSGSGNLVGGDFYDVFSDARGGWYVLLGDASGIGPEAAGLAGVARYTARALAETAPGPVDMLAQINRALLRAAPEDRFCTAVLAHLWSGPDGTVSVTLASGGHPSPLVQRASGAVETAARWTGLVLGIVPDAEVGVAKVVLEPGDAIAFYTDGVTEAHAPGSGQFGEERLVAVLADAHTRSAAGTARRVERAVMDYRSPDDHDDLAIVVVRCRPAP